MASVAQNVGCISKATASDESSGNQVFVPVKNPADLEDVLTSRLPLSANVSL